MTAAAPPEVDMAGADRPLARRRSRLRWHWTAIVGLGTFAAIALLVLFAPAVASHDPISQNVAERLAGPSASHWLGLDHLGRDVFSRLLHGGRFSMVIAAVTVVISAVLGTLLGALSGRIGGGFDESVMRTVDLLISFPEIVVALVLVALLGPSFGTMVLALSVLAWSPFARLARGLTLEVNTKEFIEAAEGLGCSRLFIVFRHVLPNIFGPVFAMGFLRFGHKLITVGSLSYLGLGAQPPTPDWGAMLSDAQPYMQREPLLILAPGFLIFITALSVTMAGQGLSIMLDPKQRSAAPKRKKSKDVVSV